MAFGERRLFLRNRERARELVIFHAGPRGGSDCFKDFVSEVDLSGTKSGGGKFNRIFRNVRFEGGDVLAPRERFTAARDLRRLRHDAARGQIIGI